MYLQTLIKEKQNTTATIGLGLSTNQAIIDTLKNNKNSRLNLQSYSIHLKKSSNFKNVWFQLISKEGISLQRSWTDFKGDKVSDVRIDIQEMIKKPKIMNSMSVGKFDMTFKSMVPIYDLKKEFLGIIEVITHFNSISKNLKAKGIDALILADKKYKKQLSQAFTKKF